MTDGLWVGQPVARKEDLRLLRGRGEFIADLPAPTRTQEVAILRSPHAHARIARIDAAPALDLPGVSGVFVGSDAKSLGNPLVVQAPVPQRYYPIAIDKVRFVGEPVAVVAAETRRQAEDALAAIEVDFDPLPSIASVADALSDRAPALDEEFGTNVVIDRVLRYGDVDAAFERADHVVRGRYVYPKVSSTPIETYGVIADWAPDDSVTVWANFQGPFSLHHVMAKALRLPTHALRVIVPPDIGGGFGIKISIYPYMVLM
ncbi:MAG: molybdopterin-dependent oxidoreductase, partial [Alphaproteobacteria bacterium]|nr:molybdopterin-dependent oxidoreductase [Alphaproteobacteria bacterium]